MASNENEVIFLKKLNEFVRIGIPYVWSFSDDAIEKPEIPNESVFKARTSDDVMVTQFLMRWYFKKLFEFTFKRDNFKNEIKFFWQTWIVNRNKIYEKLVDAITIIIEASLHCSKFKNYELSMEEGLELFTEWFTDLKSEFVESGGWDTLYESASNYDELIAKMKEMQVSGSSNNDEPPFSDLGLLRLLKQSTIVFPICSMTNQPTIEGQKFERYVFVRLHTEMEPYYNEGLEAHLDHRGWEVTHLYYPQDRVNSIQNFTRSAPDVTHDAALTMEINENNRAAYLRIFASRVLKINNRDTLIHLISQRYKNSIDELLSKRYSDGEKIFYGSSAEPTNSKYGDNKFYIRRKPGPTEGNANYIKAAHLVIAWYSFKQEIPTNVKVFDEENNIVKPGDDSEPPRKKTCARK